MATFGLSRIQMPMNFDKRLLVKFDLPSPPKKSLAPSRRGIYKNDIWDRYSNGLTLLAKMRQSRMVIVSWLWQKKIMYNRSGLAGCWRKNLKGNVKGINFKLQSYFLHLETLFEVLLSRTWFLKGKSGLPHHLTRFRLNRSALCMHLLVRGRNFGENLSETCSFYLVRINNVFLYQSMPL